MIYSINKKLQKVVNEYLIVVIIVILVLVTIIIQPKFLTAQNFKNIISQLGALSLVSLGMTLVIIGGFIDLSVAGIISLVAVVTIHLIDPLGQIPALVIGLGLGIFLGWLNSCLVLSSGAMTKFEALFITFGMSTVYGAIALIASGGSTLQMRWLKTNASIYENIGSGSIGVISIPVIIFFICLIALHIFQSKTYIGRSISLTGGNRVAAELSGIPVRKSIIIVFIISGFMAALAGVVLFSRVTQASPVIGLNYETNAILAVVVGGTSLKGGKGSVIRTLMGVLLVTLISNCMNLLSVSTYYQTIMRGAMLVLAIWLDNRKDRKGAL